MEIVKNAIVDTEEDFDFLTEAGHKRVMEECDQAERDGYIKLPDWFPGGLPGYDWRLPGNYFAYMKPKPKLRHVLRYWFFGRHGWWYAWKQNRETKKMLTEARRERRTA